MKQKIFDWGETHIRPPCEDPTKSLRFTKILNSITGLLSDTDSLRILDLSTGMGMLSILIKRKFNNHSITACDIIIKDEVKNSFRHQNIDFVEGVEFKCGSFLPFETGYFDIVIFTDALEHIIDSPEHIFSEINRVLKKGGVLVLTTPNFCHIVSRMKCLFGKQTQSYLSEERHFRMYTQSELLFVLKGDFQIKSAEFINVVEGWRFKGFSKVTYWFYLLIVNLKPSFRMGILILAEKL